MMRATKHSLRTVKRARTTDRSSTCAPFWRRARRRVKHTIFAKSPCIGDVSDDLRVGSRRMRSSGISHLLTGERVGIRRPTMADADKFLAMTQASEAFHRPWVDPPKTRERFKE